VKSFAAGSNKSARDTTTAPFHQVSTKLSKKWSEKSHGLNIREAIVSETSATIPNESAIRRKAKRHGYFVTKSRERKYVPHSNNYGEYMLIETQYNVPILGWNYDASLEDIADFLSDEAVTA
jgi:hypothetical protein